MEAPIRPRLRPLVSRCKTDPPLSVAAAFRRALGRGRDPNDRQASIIVTREAPSVDGGRLSDWGRLAKSPNGSQIGPEPPAI